MTGWRLIIFLLLLGGVLSTLGDLLGSRIGKARLSIFKLRPRRTAVLITIFTGSLISGISLILMIFVNEKLRIGLFELDDIQAELKEKREELIPLNKQREALQLKINKAEKELIKMSKGLSDFYQGEVVIASGQSLGTFNVKLLEDSNVKEEIENIIRRANFNAFIRVSPGKIPDRRMVLVRRDHIASLAKIISDKREWVVIIRSAGNVLLGENYVFAFPEVILNKNIVAKGELISSENITNYKIKNSSLKQQVKNLLASTLAEVKKRGSLATEIHVESDSMQYLLSLYGSNDKLDLKVDAISQSRSDTADPISIILRVNQFPDTIDKNN